MIVETAEEMREIAERLGREVRPGDVIMLSGPLGAGKTTFVQGLARGMNVKGRVTSPTFVVSHVHSGPVDLVHVDAYRLEDVDEVDALDLETSMAESVTVIEWGRGKTDHLAGDRLDITISRPVGSPEGADPEDLYADAARTLSVEATGPRSSRLAGLFS